jgi:hypothetical protein
MRKVAAQVQKRASETGSQSDPVSPGDYIRALRRELADREQQQTNDLKRAITTEFGGSVCASQVWENPELRRACLDADLDSPQAVGYWMRDAGFRRLYRDDAGIIWTAVGLDNLQDAPRILDNDDV